MGFSQPQPPDRIKGLIDAKADLSDWRHPSYWELVYELAVYQAQRIEALSKTVTNQKQKLDDLGKTVADHEKKIEELRASFKTLRNKA